MQLHFKLVNKTLIASISGEIDHHTCENLRDKVDSQFDNCLGKNIIFDFAGVSFMDSAGIGVVIGRYKKVSPLGGKIAIVNARPNIKRILEISGISKISGLFDSVDNALLYL
jgi:stage II sporulation protein AA (anti-sigma F factor antagonist)